MKKKKICTHINIDSKAKRKKASPHAFFVDDDAVEKVRLRRTISIKHRGFMAVVRCALAHHSRIIGFLFCILVLVY